MVEPIEAEALEAVEEARFGLPEEAPEPKKAKPVPVTAVLHTGEGDKKDRELVVEDPGEDVLPNVPWLDRAELLRLHGEQHVQWSSTELR